jgi:hypothetical protein
MKRSTISALSLVIAASLCMSGTAFADTHPQGQVDIKVTNMSDSVLRFGAKPTRVWGSPHEVGWMVIPVKGHLMPHSKLVHGESARFLAKYEFDKNTMPTKMFGTAVTFKKAYRDKCGDVYYKYCTLAVKAGPGKTMYLKHGSLCHHLDVKTSSGSGTISYVNAVYK